MVEPLGARICHKKLSLRLALYAFIKLYTLIMSRPFERVVFEE